MNREPHYFPITLSTNTLQASLQYTVLGWRFERAPCLWFEKVIRPYSWGAEGRVLGARAPTKISEKFLQLAGTHKVLAGKVSENGNFRWFTDTVYPCKMLIHVMWRNDVHVQIHVSISACACIDFSLLSLNPYIVTNQCVYNCTSTYLCCNCKWHPRGHPQTFFSCAPHGLIGFQQLISYCFLEWFILYSI